MLTSQTLESHERTKQYIVSFQARLQTPYPAFIPPTITPKNQELPLSSSAAGEVVPPAPKAGISRVATGLVISSGKADEQPQAKTPAALTPEASAAATITPVQPQIKPMKPITVKGGLEDFSLLANHAAGNQVTSGDSTSALKPSHRWLDATDAFAQCINNVWQKVVKELRKEAATGTGKGPLPEIIVALIDDGVDTTQDHLVGRILPGRTLGFDGDRVRPWHASENGHGTIMASMICRVCPMVKIYPIRLRTGSRGIDPQSAVDAIEAAVERGVDIISMSWTVAAPAQGDLQRAFDNALQRAIDNDILMFCSSKDSGHIDDSDYPAGYRPNSVIKIGAANPTGLPYDWAGSLDRLDFIFPGVEVIQRHANPPEGVDKLPVEKTGSSVATALGAGLASLIMYCTNIGSRYGKVGLNETHFHSLHKRDVMVETIRAFGRSSSKETDGKFIEVWKRLEGKTQELTRASTSHGRDLVATLARDLVSTST